VSLGGFCFPFVLLFGWVKGKAVKKALGAQAEAQRAASQWS